MKAVILLTVVVVAGGFCLVSGYKVEPVKAQWSGMADPNPLTGGVSQVITCNFDELDSASSGYVELFTGFHGDSGAYHLDIYENQNGPRVAYRHDVMPGRDHTWLRFDRIRLEPGEVFTKGEKYEFKFTRSGGDSIQYYYDEACGYNYGQMIAPYPPPSLTTGLAMRVYGRMDAADSAWVGMDASFPTPMLAQSD